MKEKIFKNFGLKVLSAVLAVVLWTVIVNIYDPTTSYTFSNVTVQLINTDSLTDKNYSFEVVDGSKISVYVSGPKSVVTNIKASDIVAVADLSKVSAFADYVDITVSVVKDGQTLATVEATPKTSAIKLKIENRDTKTLDVESEVSGYASSGYAIVKEQLNPTSVKVTGPSSVIESVERAVIKYDVTGATADVTGTADIVIYDSEGNEVDKSLIALTQDSVDYTAFVSKSKKVSVEAKTSGKPATDYVVTDVSLSQSEVVIYGSESVLAGISKIVIPSDNININGLSADKVFKFTLSDYLDSSVGIISNSRIEVTVKISKKVTKTITINTSDIKVNNLSTSLNLAYNSPTVTLEVEGAESLISELDSTGVEASINLDDISAVGDENVPLSVKLSDGLSLKGTPNVSIKLTSKNTAGTTQPETTGNGNDSTPSTTQNNTIN